jgi:hypothetical protein
MRKFCTPKHGDEEKGKKKKKLMRPNRRRVRECQRTMMIFPVVLERRMTRRASFSLCFLRRSMPTHKRNETQKIYEIMSREREIIKGPTDAHLGPRRGLLLVRRKLEHFRLDRIGRLLIFLSLAFPTMKSRRLRPRQPILLQRALSRRSVTS